MTFFIHCVNMVAPIKRVREGGQWFDNRNIKCHSLVNFVGFNSSTNCRVFCSKH